VRRVRIGVALRVGQDGLVDAIADREVTVAALEQPLGPSFELGDLLVGEPRLALQLLRPLERRRRITEPDSLKIGLAVWSAWGSPD
jgi:hypothetical protein